MNMNRQLQLLFLSACGRASLGVDPNPPLSAPLDVPPTGWQAEVAASVQAHARRFEPDGDAFVTVLPAGARAHLRADGLHLGDPVAGALRLRLAGWGTSESLSPTPPQAPLLGDCVAARLPEGECARQLEYSYEGLTAWWINQEEGLEFGWTVSAAPAGDAPLRFVMEVHGADWIESADAGALLVDASGQSWEVSPALAWDATGAPLTASLRVEGYAIEVLVERSGAVLPITVDPVISAAGHTLTGTEAYSFFGFAVDGAGDVNGDGFADVLVSAPYQNHGGLVDVGYVWIYHGSAAGLSAVATTALHGDAKNAYFGDSAAGAGDINGDGFADIVVGSPGSSLVHPLGGAAFAFYGSAGGILSSAQTLLGSATEDAWFGDAVDGAGDVNGDGYGDVVVGDPWCGLSAGTDEGCVLVYHGSAAGLVSTAAIELRGGGAKSDCYGASLSSAGDVNGDGYADLLVGMAGADVGLDNNVGFVYLHLGSASGVSATPEATYTGAAADEIFGETVAAAGDVNQDGYGDVLIGAPYADVGALTGAGTVQLFLGSAAGLSATPAIRLEGDQAGGFFGDGLTGEIDVNGDGIDDIAVGAWRQGAGAVYVYEGSPGGLGITPTATLLGGRLYDMFGDSIGGAGDVNGDGYDDIIAGAVSYDSGGAYFLGRAYLHYGYADADGDGAYLGGAAGDPQDCDDADASVGIPTLHYADGDGDGYGAGLGELLCPGEPGKVESASDCDDSRADVHPGAAELCDSADVDEDCDGAADDADPSTDPAGHATTYGDADGDTFGDPAAARSQCDAPSDHVADATDCDDRRADVNPGATERCDDLDLDEDCDGLADDADTSVSVEGRMTVYVDADGDAAGDPSHAIQVCDLPVGHVLDGNDCDDSRAQVHPSATERCDAEDLDEDCDGVAEDADASVDPDSRLVWFPDADGDAFGSPSTFTLACEAPAAHVSADTDCNDSRADVNPGAPEVCDRSNTDENCNGQADDGDGTVDPATQKTVYPDADGDTFGDDARATQACDLHADEVWVGGDCDDLDPLRHPGADERVDGIDQDCDGADVSVEPEVTAAAPSTGGKAGCTTSGGLPSLAGLALLLLSVAARRARG
jgi:hypothetical protein